MKVKVIKYHKHADHHECIVEGETITKNLDMTTNGDFEELEVDSMSRDEMDAWNEGLVGREFEVDSLDAYVSFACGITEIT